MPRLSTYSALMAVTGVVLATNTPPPVPQDAQIGLLNFNVTCLALNALNYTFNTVFSATAPIYYGSGQEIYYTDVVGLITIPPEVIALGGLVSAKHATADADIHLTLTNASPNDFPAFTGTINNITIPPSGSALIRIPPGDGTLPPIGPITLGEVDVAHRIFLGDVSIQVQLQNETYGNIGPPIPVTCGKQDISYVIGSINVDNSTGPPFAPANGFQPEFPPTPAEFESGSFRFPYACNFGSLGAQTVDLLIGGTLPTYFAPGQSFYLSNSQSFLYAPSSLISTANQVYPNATTLSLDVTQFDLEWQNASPATYNVAGSGLSTTVNIQGAGSNPNFTIPIPNDGSLNIGPFTAGADNTYAAVAVGHSVFKAALQDAEGNTLFSFDGTCDPAAPLELIAVPVTSVIPGDYTLGINTAPSSTAAAPGASSTSSALFSLPSLSLPFFS